MADKKVMASGTFDLLHMGHVHYLREAKKLGSELTVVVATDDTVRRLKHDPINPQNIRLALIRELRCVDTALIGSNEPEDMYKILNEIQPDIIALGYDQYPQEKNLRKELDDRGYEHIKIRRLSEYESGSDLEGTRRIIHRILVAHEFQKKMEMIEGGPCTK